jgi:competence ComEA-like helix-hairpin-helix protein
VRPGFAVIGLVLPCLVVVSRPSRVEAGKAVDGVVNLNTAPADVLALLPGIGPAKATAILAYRKRHPFRTVDELVRIKGVGRKMVRRLRVHLAAAGPTTATAARPGAPAIAPAPKPAPPAIHPLHAPPHGPANASAHPTHPVAPAARLRARAAERDRERERAMGRPWRAACLGSP